ncbi:probable serine/threonine-protein kinase roco4 isoform X2 [Dysidea avara]|uniref:probable serine/threonine-protein kinase roco4 isoform X2 n=1 Tax=Dysidea avara TaxID=196820 RepID=UPI003318E0B2
MSHTHLLSSREMDEFQGLVLKGVIKLDRKELGRGAYGRVYAIKYCGTICAAKEIHSILVEEVGDVEMRRTVESFMRECRQCSTLRHPNVIQFLGVYYPSVGAGDVQGRMRLPVMVMEMMVDSLTSLVDKHEKIPVHIKFSIVHDVSLGLCYLHNHDPPIIHRDLSPNNILLTAHHVAKISDLGVAKVIKADSRKTMTKAPGTIDFMPPESFMENPEYGPPMDVFSFAGIVLHTFNQKWPHPTELVQYDRKTRKMVALSEVERRQQYLNKMRGEAEVLRPLVEECLDYDPAVRPTIATVCERIQVSKDVYMKEYPQDVITLHQQVEKDNENDQLRSENSQKSLENNQLKAENEQQKRQLAERDVQINQLKFEVDKLNQQLSSTRSVPTQQVASQLNRVTLGGPTTKTSKLKIEAPPLMTALNSGRYHIKWTQLANLPAPMYGAYVTVQDKKVYVAGGSTPVDDAQHQVYVYDTNTDHWDQLPPSGHYLGVPHIIGGRSRPGVVTHLEHVIVAGGGKYVNNTPVVQDDIEVLNWVVKNSHWQKVSINLPIPMAYFTPIITDDHLLIVDYVDADFKGDIGAYKIPVDGITRSGDQQQTSDTPTKWITMTNATHYNTALVPSSSPPVVVGGQDQSGTTPTSDIKMYDDTSKSWMNIASLSSARTEVAIAAVNNNAIIVIGGCTKGGSMANAMSSSLTTVELGQAQLIH